jgi:hypothetical protein
MRRQCTAPLHSESYPEWIVVTRISTAHKFQDIAVGWRGREIHKGVIHVYFLTRGVTMHSITVTCFVMLCTKLFGRREWEIVKDHPRA